MNTQMWRHGDVQLTALAAPPDLTGATKLPVPIAAAGKATGHSHLLDAGAEVYETADGRTRYVHVKSSANIAHAEHAAFDSPLQAGWYRSDIKRQGHDEAWSDVED